MGSNLAPGVEIIERSFSTRLEAGDQTIFATLGLFQKGPVNEATRILSTNQLIEVFGKPTDATYKYFFPISTMLDQAPVQIVRVEDGGKLCSGMTVATSGGDTVTTTTSIATSAYPLSYNTVFTPDDFNQTQVDLTGYSDTITFAAVGPGTYYNNIGVATINKTDYDLLRDLQLSLAEAITPAEVQELGQTTYNLALSGSGGLTFSIAEELIDDTNSYDIDGELLDTYLFFENGPSVDTEFAIYEFEGNSIVNAYLVSVDPEAKNSNNKSNFANKVLEQNSTNLRCFVSDARATADAVTPVSSPKTYLAGADTLSENEQDIQDDLYIQLNNNFYNKDEIRFTALVDLDFPLAIKQRMDQICQIRQDAIAILNVPVDKMISLDSGQKVANATTAIKNWTDNDLNINSSYSGLYANYFQVYDAYNDENRWVPCTGHVANRMAYTFKQFEPWYAFAGLERGIISGVLKVAFNPDDARRKVLYPARVNCIVDFRGEGVVIWGQKTLLATPSSLDRLNVRNLFIYVEIALARFSRYTLFKQNDGLTRAEWVANVNPFLNSIKGRRGLLEYLVVCDESNNTPEVVARNEFQAYVLLRPTPVVEFIKILVADVGGNLTFSEVLGGVQL